MYRVEYEKFVLENGLNVILHEDNNLPLTAEDDPVSPGDQGDVHL